MRSEKRVIGNCGSQPPTIVERLPSTDTLDIAPIVSFGKTAFASLHDIWPEPSRVTERETKWHVWFDHKQKLVETGGRQLLEMRLPASVMVEVEKSDLSARVIPGR
jgi:hypothetical protein